jgi:spore coat polysaccharide biosynthesis protein SpsF
MKKVVFIQARMESSRLPKKVLYKINSEPLLKIMYDRLLDSHEIDDIIICIPINKTSDMLADFCSENNMLFYRGSETNVLDRFYQANKIVKADVIIRCTADCPLIDYKILDQVLEFYENNTYDFVGFFSNIKGYPSGFDIEIFNNDMLTDSWNHQDFRNTKEHVTTYMRESNYTIYNFKDIIHVEFGNLDPTDIHLSVDTIEDFNLVEIIYSKLGKRTTLQEIIKYIVNNPKIIEINKNIHEKKVK